MAPEWTIVALNALLLLVAYGVLYPALGVHSAARLWKIDSVVTALAMVVAGVLFAGHGLRFSLLIFDTNWVVFTFLTMLVIEWPLFVAYCRKHDIRWQDFGADGGRSDD